MLKRLRDAVLVALFSFGYWTYSRFWRVQRVKEPKLPKNLRFIYAHWHGDELLLVPIFAYSNVAAMVSRSKDGELMKRILGKLGYFVVRGSSTRGGAGGLKGLIDAVNQKQVNASLAVDGPRGPIYQVKPGIIKLAQETRSIIVPGACASNRRFIFKKAWNQCYLPFPFSRNVIVFGEPIEVPQELTDSQFEEQRQNLERRLLELKAEAESTFRRDFRPALKTVFA